MMSQWERRRTKLPLFPLPDVVHFPHTTLKLLIQEPRYRRLVRHLLDLDEESRLVGIVVVKPGLEEDEWPEIFPGGTAGRVVEAELLPEGTSTLLLEGDFRFEIDVEVEGEPYRQALVRPIAEPALNEEDAGIQAVRRDILSILHNLADELGESFPIGGPSLEDLELYTSFEELVNWISVEIDAPLQRKLQLLVESLPQRALTLLELLRAKGQVLDLLRPYRHLAGEGDLN